MRISDWSSDVCSSDLVGRGEIGTVQDGPREIRVLQLASRHIGAAQHGVAERGTDIGIEDDAFGIEQGTFPEVGAAQRGVGEIGALEGRAAQIGPGEIGAGQIGVDRSEEHTYELQSLMSNSYAD